MNDSSVDQPVLALRGVSLRYRLGDPLVLNDLDWEVRAGERWVVLGPNGCGKSSLAQIATLRLHPSAGDVEVFGERLGTFDVRSVRPSIGYAGANVANALRPALTASDAVMTARRGALEPWWHTYDGTDIDAARHSLASVGCAHLADRLVGSLSSGERQRVLLARALVNNPRLLVLDEPAAGLDFGGREDVIESLETLAEKPEAPPMVLVTHHLEEVPASFTHGLLLHGGSVMASGPIPEVLTSTALSAVFGRRVAVEHAGGRYSARSGLRQPRQ